MSSASLPPVKIFLSYVRADDESFDIIRPLKLRLGQLITALSGRPAEIFLDREDIPLGTDWREKIEAAVRQSYFFVPIYTGSYPQSEACRDEFFIFQEAAELRGATKLIIPVIWFGLSTLLAEGEDDISDYVRAHQAALFEEAWVQGTDSPAYKRNVVQIAKRILEVSPDIDNALASAEEYEAGVPTFSELVTSEAKRAPQNFELEFQEESIDAENDGLIELSEEFTAEVALLTEAATDLGRSIEELGDLPPFDQSAQHSANTISKYMIQVASRMKQPALSIEANGQKMFQAAKKSDGIFRRIIRTTLRSESEELIRQAHSSLFESISSLEETRVVAEQMEQLLTSLKTPEALSASIRRSIRPARHGIVAVQDSIRLVSEWPDILESLFQSAESE